MTKFDGNCPVLPTHNEDISCDFSEDQCGWTNDPDNQIDWKYNAEAHEMWLDPADVGDNYRVGSFRSPVVEVGDGDALCFTMTWKKEDQVDAALSVKLYSESFIEEETLMAIHDGFSGEYRNTSVEVTRAGKHHFVVTGLVSPRWEGVMRFSSVSVTDAPCSEVVVPGGLACDFENPQQCGFHTSLPGDTAKWTWGSGTPSLDHTLDAMDGHSMFIAVNEVGSNQIAHLVTPSIMPLDEYLCITFWINIQGAQSSRLTMYLEQGGLNSLPLWTKQKSFGAEWRGARASTWVDVSQNLTVVFELLTDTEIIFENVAVDDVVITPGSCPEPVTCNFDEDLCLWTQGHLDMVNWKLVDSQGDLHDHTSGNGYFLALKTGPPAAPGDIAVLDSEPVTIADVACLSFWYNMWGSGIEHLNVQRQDGETMLTSLWKVEGASTHNESEWQYASLPVYGSSSEFLLRLQAVLSRADEEDHGTIAVDDMVLVASVECAYEPPEAEILPPTARPPTPKPTPTPGFLQSCDFEDHSEPFCGWTDISANEDYKWTIVKGALGVEGIGPVSDHTTGSGHYASVSRGPDMDQVNDEISVLQSPELRDREDDCFLFWYFLWGQSTHLSLKINGEEQWSRSGSQGNKWLPAKVVLDHSDAQWLLTLESKLGADHEDVYVAIDDFLYYDLSCENVTVVGSSGRQCDLEEADLCGWSQVTGDDEADWQWVNGTTGGLAIDHTYGTETGHFLQLASSQNGVIEHQRAAIEIQPFLMDRMGDYCFQLYYTRFGGAYIGYLKVMVVFAGQVSPFIELSDQIGVTEWTLLQQTYTNLVPNATVGFFIEGEVGVTDPDYGESVVAVDDFSLTNSACPRPGACAFEDANLCSWHVEASEDLAWQLTDGQESHDHGPQTDHTTNTMTGGYMIVEDSGEHLGMSTALRERTDPRGRVRILLLLLLLSQWGPRRQAERVRAHRPGQGSPVGAVRGPRARLGLRPGGNPRVLRKRRVRARCGGRHGFLRRWLDRRRRPQHSDWRVRDAASDCHSHGHACYHAFASHRHLRMRLRDQ
ncbi:MAM and LDL-receptor class A domain-containing protein 2-like [Penaeus monodon]|uniref:MAM and LDL-receptor class A domain-containing protein 2-like n=1 Tax=Penaeus monodon TaxID=6687 RepID=UPI0018A72CEB|nr:MAM and LDL-receptor class A domain-containing protein 2-like [Penaeus monodon]